MAHRTVKFTLVMTALWCLAPWGKTASAQSLWDRRRPQKVFLFYDTQARRVGDLVSIVIRENTDVDNRERRALEKETDTSGLLDFASTTGGDLGSSSANATVDGSLSSNRSFDGSSEFSSQRVFSDRVTATVVDVLPNGNLIVAGRRSVFVAGDEQSLVISGIVRPYDIRPDNSVESQFMYNLKVYYEGRGPEKRFTNQGWLGRIVNKIWPH